MRICSPQLGIAPHSILGGEIYDREILKGLARKGHVVDIILPWRKPHDKFKNWHVVYEPIPFVVPPHLYNFLVLPYLFLLQWRNQFDILRIHSPTFLGLAAMLFKKFYPNVPIVGIYHWLGEGGQIEHILDPYLMKVFNAIICDSIKTKKEIEKVFPQSRGKVYAIHNGVDPLLHPTAKSLKLCTRYQIRDSTVTLLYMGLFTQRKNPLILIPLMKQLVDEGHDIKLLMCGKGELEGVLQKKIDEYDLGHAVFIVSPVHGKEKNELLNTADIFVHSATNEGFSLAVLEAMAIGLPVIINDGFSAREAVIDEVTGFVCKKSAQWHSRLKQLVTDNSLRKTLGKNAIKKVQKEFAWEYAVDKHIALFKQLLSPSV